jgi:hypothetical protein
LASYAIAGPAGCLQSHTAKTFLATTSGSGVRSVNAEDATRRFHSGHPHRSRKAGQSAPRERENIGRANRRGLAAERQALRSVHRKSPRRTFAEIPHQPRRHAKHSSVKRAGPIPFATPNNVGSDLRCHSVSIRSARNGATCTTSTTAENLRGIMSSRLLVSASDLLHREDAIPSSKRRTTPQRLAASRCEYWLQTQKCLHAGTIQFESEWNLDRFVTRLNSLVFPWPGDDFGPIEYGRRHLKKNDWPSRAVAIRVPTRALFLANEENAPRFCRYNSGSPRFSGGKASPRGANTFVCRNNFQGTLSDVKEVVFEQAASLPPETQCSDADLGHWTPLASI